MQHPIKSTLSCWFIAGLLLISAGCGGQTQPPAIFLGHIATLSGQDSKAGKSAEQGIRLALEELGPAASEGWFGRPLVVRHVDAAGNLDNVEGQAARLVSINKVVGFLGGINKEEALRLDRSRVPVLAPLGFRTSGMSDLLFTTGLPPATQGRILAQFLAEHVPAAGTLIVDPRRDEALAVAESFRRAWAEAWSKRDVKGEAPRWNEIHLPKDVKHAEWARVVVKEKAKTILFAGAAADFDLLRHAWGASTPLLVYAGDDGSWTPREHIPAQMIYVATAFALGKETTKALEFTKKFRAATGDEPDVHAALAYENVRLFAEALKKGQSEKADKIAEELLKLKDVPGLSGPLSFGQDRQLRRPVFVADGTNRIPTLVKSYEP